jgi:hypothetical protein
MSLATLTKTGRAAIAESIVTQPLHFAWGSGDPAWDEDESGQHLEVSLVNAVALNNELGRRFITATGFVEPDPEGELVIPVGRQPDGTVISARFTQVPDATPNLYLRVNFDYADASNQTVREVGIFTGTVVSGDLPPGKQYFTPEELENPGKMLIVQRLDPSIDRSPAVRQSFEFVLTI